MIDDMHSLKVELHQQCLAIVDERVETIKKAIEEAQASANEESKSSVGDKYETGRAMMQLEIEKHNTQLIEALKLKRVLDQIDPQKRTDKVQAGSLVITNQGKFYLAVSIGKVNIGEKEFFAISSASPIGSKLMGLKRNDRFKYGTKDYKVENVY